MCLREGVFFSNIVSLENPKSNAMQYTANKPFTAVLLLKGDGIRYRLQEDHFFKDIRYAQITAVKLKAEVSFFYKMTILPVSILSNLAILYLDGYSLIALVNILLWGVWGGIGFLQKRSYMVEVHKGPLVAEVFITKNKKEAKQIKKEIESRL